MNRPALPLSSGRLLGVTLLGFLAASVPAQAHVKWFAPYIVGAPPQPIAATLGNAWFWTGIALTLAVFLATRAVEKSSAGEPSCARWTGSPTPSGSASMNSCASSSPASSWRSSRSAASI